MLEIGIPVYKAKDTLPALLDSIVSQTKKMFIVCLSIDGDNEDYTDIIKTYVQRGLKIRVIPSDINGGPGVARQRILDTTQCDYIMFADADDLLMPRAVEILYRKIVAGGFDIIRSSFLKEMSGSEDKVLKATDNIVTWFHGKIYKVSYLKKNNIRFLPELRTDEDAYFNMLAWNGTKNKDYIDEITYIWRDNLSSITRKEEKKEYFINHHMDYIHGQVEALKRIFQITPEVSTLLVTLTLINIYYYYMTARFYHCDEEEMDNCISSLKDESWMKLWLLEGQNWIDVLNNIKPGNVYEEEYVIFYEETFNLWAARLLRKE